MLDDGGSQRLQVPLRGRSGNALVSVLAGAVAWEAGVQLREGERGRYNTGGMVLSLTGAGLGRTAATENVNVGDVTNGDGIGNLIV